ncbi:MAG TPA: hypothetical protein VGR96_12345 [Acidobacteriaceae bacterium]|nr:hypothetical protein [Acidobacteriaceae bacterium]
MSQELQCLLALALQNIDLGLQQPESPALLVVLAGKTDGCLLRFGIGRDQVAMRRIRLDFVINSQLRRLI